ncbi:alpha/beta fold hydrolase [Pseudonocardia benzenivorans]
MSRRVNIVLVHGAWADGSSWSAVIERLQADGFTVTAPQFPESSLAADVARLRQVLARQDGPTIVAGHSYGGQIITALGTDAPNVVGLVYVAAFGLDEGESIGQLLAQAPRAPRWRTWTSTSRASPGCPRRTSSTISRPTSTRSRHGSCTRCSSRWRGPRSRR